MKGGEPTVRKDLVDIVSGLSSLEGIKSVSLTTNGLVLGRKAQALADAGLKQVNISLDTLQEQKFAMITRRKGHKWCEMSVQTHSSRS